MRSCALIYVAVVLTGCSGGFVSSIVSVGECTGAAARNEDMGGSGSSAPPAAPAPSAPPPPAPDPAPAPPLPAMPENTKTIGQYTTVDTKLKFSKSQRQVLCASL